MLSNASKSDPAMSGQLDYDLIENQYYPTPPENVDVLATFVDLRHYTVWEPACGEGHISKRLQRFAAGVISTDLIDRGYGRGGIDFLKAGRMAGKTNAIITNPPYGELADRFVAAALELTAPVEGVVAMFLRNEWDCGAGRTAPFFEHEAFAMKIIVTKRPRWIEGSKGSPRHNYAWYIWDHARDKRKGAEILHLHPKNARPMTMESITCH